MRSTILRALAALLLGAAGAAIAADSSSLSLPDVPWQKPWARTADGLQGMPTSCPDGQVLTVGSGGAFSCVEASSSTTVNQCSASVTLVGGKTQKQCCDAGGTVTSISGGVNVCRFTGSTCGSGFGQYQNWRTVNGRTCSSSAQCTAGAPSSCSVSSAPWSNNANYYCMYTPSSSWFAENCYPDWPVECVANLFEVGCI